MCNRKVRGKIPDLSIDHSNDHEVRIHERDIEQKAKAKDYADTRRRASYSDVEVGEQVLVQQDKSNKLSTPFDPNPFSATVKAATRCCRVESQSRGQYSSNRHTFGTTIPSSQKHFDSQLNGEGKSETPSTSRPQRTRRMPERFRDFVVNFLKRT